MKQITNLKDLIGLTIKKTFDINDRLFLIFEDYFCVFISEGYEDHSPEIMQSQYNLNPNAWNSSELLQLGFITKEKYDKISKHFQDENDKLIKKNELRELKKLQTKYPNE